MWLHNLICPPVLEEITTSQAYDYDSSVFDKQERQKQRSPRTEGMLRSVTSYQSSESGSASRAVGAFIASASPANTNACNAGMTLLLFIQ